MLNTELARIISKITDIITSEGKDIEKELSKWVKEKDSLEKLAHLAEFKIRKKQVRRINEKVYAILKESGNLIILSTMKTDDN